MNNREKQQLSRDVAVKYGIDDCTYIGDRIIAWLHNDSARCFELMVEHGIEVAYTKHIAVARFELTQVIQVPYNPYESKQEATRIAILKALLAKVE